jgi:hypothetical protein
MVAGTAVAHRIPAGWYRDKLDPERRRWWDGIEWTDHYAPITDPLTLEASNPSGPVALDGSTDPRMSALLESLGGRVERAIAARPETVDTEAWKQAERALRSPELAAPVAAPVRPSVPLVVIVLLAALTGANTVLLGILASGR